MIPQFRIQSLLCNLFNRIFNVTHTGGFFGIPATGNDVNVNVVTLVKMKEEKIAQEQDFMDNLEFMQQPGLIPTE